MSCSKFSRAAVHGALLAVMAICANAAQAGTVNATLSATYFQVQDNSDPDFNVNTTPTGIGATLGPDGMPTATGGVNDIGVGNQLTWWSPSMNSHVVQTGTGTITLPYSSNMYAPGSTGTNDGSYFETAMFTGLFTLSAIEDVAFQLGSDDDSFIYVDGNLIGDNPGVHSTTDVTFTAYSLGVGDHTLSVFYADRQNTGATLSLNLLTDDVVITPPSVPEPTSIALVGVALVGLGFSRRRNRV